MLAKLVDASGEIFPFDGEQFSLWVGMLIVGWPSGAFRATSEVLSGVAELGHAVCSFRDWALFAVLDTAGVCRFHGKRANESRIEVWDAQGTTTIVCEYARAIGCPLGMAALEILVPTDAAN